MVASYKNKLSGEEFNMFWGEALQANNYYGQEHPISYYTVAWNYANKAQ